MKNKKILIISVLAVLSLLFITIGATVAFFSYIGEGSTDNTIESGSINFIYEEVNKMGNGISITDAMPISDSEGKASNNYFDFKVTSSTGTTIAIPYEITTRVVDGSDDLSDYVKLYLTKVNGTNEQQVALSIYSDLNDSTNTLAQPFGDKTLYNGEIPVGATDYTENYRLRMWLNDNPTDGSVLDYSPVYVCSDTQYTNQTDCESNNGVWNPTNEYNNQNKTFSIKVNVYANGEQASQQKIESATTTDITGLKINNTLATESTNSTDNYDYYVETVLEDDNDIELIALNDGQTYTVENITEQEANTIKGISAKQDLNLVLGDNYLKVIVIAANKVNTKDYIVKVKAKSAIAKINVPEQDLSNEITITIDYHNNTNGMYKIGTNGTWEEYTGPITIKSEETYTLANDDKTITLYAKAFNESSQEEETSKTISTLDYDMPEFPIITANAGYPTLTKSGISVEKSLSVTYDNSRNDITNYVCTKNCDDETNWKLYTGNEEIESSEIKAKSVKNTTGLTALTIKEIETPTDALGLEAYDNDETTSVKVKNKPELKLYVDENMRGQAFSIKTVSDLYMKAYSTSNTNRVICNTINGANTCSGSGYNGSLPSKVFIPEDTEYLTFYSANARIKDIYDVKPVILPPDYTISKNYPIISKNGIEPASVTVTINYHKDAVLKLYRIDDEQWHYYTDPVTVPYGKTIEYKEVDIIGLSSEPVTYTALESDLLSNEVFDGDETTYFETTDNTGQNLRINISEEMRGKTISINASQYMYMQAVNNSNKYTKICYINDADLATCGGTSNAYNGSLPSKIYIPADTEYILINTGTSSRKVKIYEIDKMYISFSTSIVYPTLTNTGITKGYENITVEYPSEFIQKLYKIDNGEWQAYTEPVRVEVGKTIYIKGIDNSNNSVIDKYKVTLPVDAVGLEAYDNDETTSIKVKNKPELKLYVDENMRGQAFSIKTVSALYMKAYSTSNTNRVICNTVNGANTCSGSGYNGSVPSQIYIPEDTEYLTFYSANTIVKDIYEIKQVLVD